MRLRQLLKVSAFATIASCFHSSASAQVNINTNKTANQLLDYITGPNVTVSNAVLTCDSLANGTFVVTGNSNLNLDSGIVLSTGVVETVGGNAGINGAESLFASTSNNAAGDVDLSTLISLSTYDACKLEFDFNSPYDTVLFKYSFGSEEYASFMCTAFNDVFAFYISGPGITGTQNMAIVPGTNIPVSINSVNNSVALGTVTSFCTNLGPGAPFGNYYIDNTNGSTITYKGFTTLLEAKYPITPNNTYHLKMVVADASDVVFDSGVFIEGSSFTAKPANPNAIDNVNTKKTLVFPNPFQDKTTITLPTELNQEIITVSLNNEIGQSLYNSPIAGAQLNSVLTSVIEKCVNGSYFLKISAPNKNYNEVIRLQKIN